MKCKKEKLRVKGANDCKKGPWNEKGMFDFKKEEREMQEDGGNKMQEGWKKFKRFRKDVQDVLLVKCTNRTWKGVQKVKQKNAGFVAFDVCRLMTFVAYDVCRLWRLSLMTFVAYRVCRSISSAVYTGVAEGARSLGDCKMWQRCQRFSMVYLISFFPSGS